MAIVHHQLIYQAEVENLELREGAESVLKQFLYELVKAIEMQVLIGPQLKLSSQNAWSGLIGIVTSHIAFHYWINEKYVQVDIYSCKKFNIEIAINFLNKFWNARNVNAIFINREAGKEFEIKKLK